MEVVAIGSRFSYIYFVHLQFFDLNFDSRVINKNKPVIVKFITIIHGLSDFKQTYQNALVLSPYYLFCFLN